MDILEEGAASLTDVEMEAVRSSETLVNTNQTTCRPILEYYDLHVVILSCLVVL
jgi:hypothetical protein